VLETKELKKSVICPRETLIASVLEAFNSSTTLFSTLVTTHTTIGIVLQVVGAEEVAQWSRLDDVIMGGRSSSYWQLTNPEGKGPVAVWQGELVMTGGGFCGTRSPPGLAVDLSGFDGLSLRVKGDGQRYKV